MVLHRDLLSLLGIGRRVRQAQEVVYHRVGYGTAGLDFQETRHSEGLKLSSLLLWQLWLAGSQSRPTGGGARTGE